VRVTNGFGLIPPISPARAEKSSRPATEPFATNLRDAAGSSSTQFSPWVLWQLLNAQQPAGTITPLQYGADGKARLAESLPSQPADDGQAIHGVFTTSGQSGDLRTLDAAQAARDILRAIGSEGRLRLRDVESYLGLTDPRKVDDPMRALLVSDWSKLTGGAESLSESELADAIQDLKFRAVGR